MANTTVGASVQVEFASVGQMRKAIKEATSDLIVLTDKFGATSDQAIAAAKKVASLKDAIGDAKALADTFNPDKKFVALGGALQGAVAGFSALQGAIGLFGSESKDVEKILLKVQSAMALQQGISGIAGAMDSFKMLAGTIRSKVVTAFSTLKGAIIGTGIGALGVALGLIIANFDEFKKAIFRLVPGLETVAKFVGGLVTQFTDFIGVTSQAERNLEKLTKANKRANEGIDAQIKLLQAQGGKEEEIYKLKKVRSDNELVNLRESLKVKGKLSEEELKQFRDLKNEQQVLDIEEVNRKKKIAEDEAKKAQDAANKAKQKREEDAKKKKQEEEEEKKRQEQIQKNTEENLKNNAKRTRDLENQLRVSKITDEKERIKLENQIKLEDELYAETERYKSGEVRLEQYLANLVLIRQRYANEDNLRKQEEDEKEKERMAQAHENTRKMVEEQNAALLQAEIDLQNKRFDAASAGLQLLESLAGQNEKIANIIFAVQKGLEIARIITDTARGIVAAKAGLAAVPPFIGVSPNPAFALAAANAAKQIIGLKIAAATSIASIAGTSISKFKKGGGASAGGGGADVSGGGAAPITAQPTPTVTAQALNAQAINQLGNQSMRAYILNSDMQNNEQRNAYLERNARLG